MIEFQSISFSYFPESPVITKVSLRIESGMTLVVGPNGSGKSTFLKLASGLEPPDSGRILIDGIDLWKNEVEARSRLAYLPEFPDLTPYASLQEVMDLVCRLRRVPTGKGRRAFEFFGLQNLVHRTVRTLSKGERKRALFAACLVGSPRHILLDEPLDGLDRAISRKVLAWIAEKISAGVCLVVVSHDPVPFIESATGAIGFQNRSAEHMSLLSQSVHEKAALLDEMARGESD